MSYDTHGTTIINIDVSQRIRAAMPDGTGDGDATPTMSLSMHDG